MTIDRPRPKRGAPFGNRNALKHGLYARRRFAPRPPREPAPAAVEPPLPDQHEPDFPQPEEDGPEHPLSLAMEIALLRLQFSLLFFSGTCCSGPGELATVLRNMSYGAIAISRLVMAEEYLMQNDTPQIEDFFFRIVGQNYKKDREKQDARLAAAAQAPIIYPDLEADYPGIHYFVQQRGIDVRDIRHLLPPIHTYRTNPKYSTACPTPPPGAEGKPPPEE